MDHHNPVGKQDVIRHYLETYSLNAMVETGIYNGAASGMQMLDLIDGYWLLDIQLGNCAQAKRSCPSARVVCGDSAYTLWTVCEEVSEGFGPALYWLDAHMVEEYDGDLAEIFPNPLSMELGAIQLKAHWRSVVLIDDLRMMGQPGWPTLEHVRGLVDPGLWETEERDDIMRLTPRGIL